MINKNFLDLDLASNNITEKGVAIICDALQKNNTLISLSLKSFEGLNRNKVASKGCDHIGKYLYKTKVNCYDLDFDVSQSTGYSNRSIGFEIHL